MGNAIWKPISVLPNDSIETSGQSVRRRDKRRICATTSRNCCSHWFLHGFSYTPSCSGCCTTPHKAKRGVSLSLCFRCRQREGQVAASCAHMDSLLRSNHVCSNEK